MNKRNYIGEISRTDRKEFSIKDKVADSRQILWHLPKQGI